jgi:hypothetical protein
MTADINFPRGIPNGEQERRKPSFPVCALSAAVQGVLLLPLPLFWDALTRLDWQILRADGDYLPQVSFASETSAYFKLRNMAHFSPRHLLLLGAFWEHAYGKPAPARPCWALF